MYRVRWSSWWCAVAAAVVINGHLIASAQSVAVAVPLPVDDSALQGHVLQRSDGALFVYRDGARYAVQPAPLSDEEIDAIPEAGPPLDRVDLLFAPAAPAGAAAASAPTAPDTSNTPVAPAAARAPSSAPTPAPRGSEPPPAATPAAPTRGGTTRAVNTPAPTSIRAATTGTPAAASK